MEQLRTVNSVVNSTFMTVDIPFAYTNASALHYKSYIKGKILPIIKNINGPNGYIQVTNTTSFTIASGQIPSSTLTVDVTYDILRTTTVPAKKK
jgi:hypothetical protein